MPGPAAAARRLRTQRTPGAPLRRPVELVGDGPQAPLGEPALGGPLDDLYLDIRCEEDQQADLCEACSGETKGSSYLRARRHPVVRRAIDRMRQAEQLHHLTRRRTNRRRGGHQGRPPSR